MLQPLKFVGAVLILSLPLAACGTDTPTPPTAAKKVEPKSAPAKQKPKPVREAEIVLEPWVPPNEPMETDVAESESFSPPPPPRFEEEPRPAVSIPRQPVAASLAPRFAPTNPNAAPRPSVTDPNTGNRSVTPITMETSRSVFDPQRGPRQSGNDSNTAPRVSTTTSVRPEAQPTAPAPPRR